MKIIHCGMVQNNILFVFSSTVQSVSQSFLTFQAKCWLFSKRLYISGDTIGVNYLEGFVAEISVETPAYVLINVEMLPRC